MIDDNKRTAFFDTGQSWLLAPYSSAIYFPESTPAMSRHGCATPQARKTATRKFLEKRVVGQAHAKAAVLNMIGMRREKTEGLVITGPVGCGKTCLVDAITEAINGAISARVELGHEELRAERIAYLKNASALIIHVDRADELDVEVIDRHAQQLLPLFTNEKFFDVKREGALLIASGTYEFGARRLHDRIAELAVQAKVPPFEPARARLLSHSRETLATIAERAFKTTLRTFDGGDMFVKAALRIEKRLAAHIASVAEHDPKFVVDPARTIIGIVAEIIENVSKRAQAAQSASMIELCVAHPEALDGAQGFKLGFAEELRGRGVLVKIWGPPIPDFTDDGDPR